MLTVNTPTTSSVTDTACGSYTWNGTTYTTSGTYTFVTKNAVGCDSTATLVLTVNNPSSSTTDSTIVTTALPFTWNGLTFTDAGTQTAHLFNSNGCDSAATLVLSVLVPVNLKSFSGVYGNGSANLTWSSANESDLSKYTIQRSTNGIDFVNIKSIPATNKLGGASYNYSDAINTSGKLYYRLQLVDKSGVSTYSTTVVVTVGANYSLSLYPNPVKNVLTLHITNDKSEKVSIQVVNVLGKQVHQQQAQLNAGNTDVSLDVANFAQGNYIVVIKGEHLQQKQFIKL